MPLETNKQANTDPVGYTISTDVKDHGNDPYFIKKNKQAREFVQKHGFPKELLLILKNRMPV